MNFTEEMAVSIIKAEGSIDEGDRISNDVRLFLMHHFPDVCAIPEHAIILEMTEYRHEYPEATSVYATEGQAPSAETAGDFEGVADRYKIVDGKTVRIPAEKVGYRGLHEATDETIVRVKL